MLTIKIPSAGGGEEEGLNDPGVELFLGDVERNLARESAQNAIDAMGAGSSVVELSFDLLKIPRADVPCVDQIADALLRCRNFWTSNRKSLEFFDAAIREIGAADLAVLRVRDRYTTGLTGTDGERTGRWYGLVRSAGVSNKAEGAGGSYGIGKYAPFAASPIRTILYSTKTEAGETAFQGVMRLASHLDAEGNITRRTGYIGDNSGSVGTCSAIRQESDIPRPFRKTEPGTDIYILGFNADGAWKNRVISSILQNFWPAIHRKIISFRVAEKTIDHSNLVPLLSEFSAEDGFESHLYHRALVSGILHQSNIPNIGPVSLYLLADGEDLPKRVALTRKTGMVIELKTFRSRRPFSGYLVCEDRTGNELLGSMEPPRHDEWNPKRGTDAAPRALKQLYDWIREKIRELNPTPTAEALDVPELSRYLPFDEAAEQAGDGPADADSIAEPRFSATPRTQKITLRPTPPKSPRTLETTENGGEGTGDGNADES